MRFTAPQARGVHRRRAPATLGASAHLLAKCIEGADSLCLSRPDPSRPREPGRDRTESREKGASTAMTTLASLDPAVEPTTVAFYLPQFHPIPENDEWWGAGFTEWTNVRRAMPLFLDHEQPARPVGPHGEYSLLDPAVVPWQVDLALQHDVDAFCYYHYWFDGKRLLERPLDSYLATDLRMPFCICWANENWSRRWDGKSREVLIGQRYAPETPNDVFDSFLPYLSDSRYLRSDGKLVLLVHRVRSLPDPMNFADVWRERARQQGLGELWLVANETTAGLDPRRFGFDAVAEFPPVGDSGLTTTLLRPPEALHERFRGRLLSYDRLMLSYLSRRKPDFPRHRGLVPRWDNTPRRLLRSTVCVGSSPASYGRWLAAARASERAARPDGGLVFINAWNEWAEGAYLEADRMYGQEYLRATRRNYIAAARTAMPTRPGRLSPPFVYGLLRATGAGAKNALWNVGRAAS